MPISLRSFYGIVFLPRSASIIYHFQCTVFGTSIVLAAKWKAPAQCRDVQELCRFCIYYDGIFFTHSRIPACSLATLSKPMKSYYYGNRLAFFRSGLQRAINVFLEITDISIGIKFSSTFSISCIVLSSSIMEPVLFASLPASTLENVLQPNADISN